MIESVIGWVAALLKDSFVDSIEEFGGVLIDTVGLDWRIFAGRVERLLGQLPCSLVCVEDS